MSPPHGQRGFSLLEVLVAFVLLAMALALILQIFSTGVAASGRTAAHGRAVTLATSLLARLDAEPVLREEQRSGSNDGMRWRMAIQPAPEPLAGSGQTGGDGAKLYRIRLQIRWQRDGGGGEVTLQTLRLGGRS